MKARLLSTSTRLLQFFGLLVLAHLTMAATALAQMAPAPGGPVIISIAGGITHHNRGASDPKRDGFFAYHEIQFSKAFGFDLEMLDAMPQHEITCQPPQYAKNATFRGPRLVDVLKKAGAQNVSIKTRALDGFAVDLTSQEIMAKDWILATRADGKPFGIGGKGPVWLMHTPSVQKVPEAEEQGWPWAVFYIETKK